MQYKVCVKGIMVMMMVIINNINNIGSNDDKINSDHHHHHLSELRRRPREGSCNIRKIKPIHLLHSCIRRLKLLCIGDICCPLKPNDSIYGMCIMSVISC